MNEDVKILLPKLGESIHSATIVQWFKQIGDLVHLDEPLLEVSTDKVNSEIPSPVAGILKEVHAHPDQELQVGSLIAVVSQHSEQKIGGIPQPIASSSDEENRGFFSPALLRLAKEGGIPLEDLNRMKGSGMGGRVTKRDLEEMLAEKSKVHMPPPCPLKASMKQGEASEEIQRLKMSGMRKAIADNLVRSFYEAPHATLVTEVDVTSILKYLQREKEAFQAKHGFKLTITAFVARAISLALREYPLLNSSLEGDTILVKHFVNLGIAVSVDQGLLVPVIKHSQNMGITQLAQAIGEASAKARTGQLNPDEVSEGTITLTNFGISGVHMGVPIIRYPEVAIIGIGAIHKKVVPLEDDLLAVRSVMHICLTFDHRVLDGMYGCGFLGSLKRHLEEDALTG